MRWSPSFTRVAVGSIEELVEPTATFSRRVAPRPAHFVGHEFRKGNNGSTQRETHYMGNNPKVGDQPFLGFRKICLQFAELAEKMVKAFFLLT